MGMFDDITLGDDVLLPDGYQGRSFQSKDLDCELDRYRIEGGVLAKFCCDLEKDGDPRPHHIWPDQLHQYHRRINERWEPVAFHGWLNFYDFDQDDNWHEYNAKFTDGRLVEIVQVGEKA